MANPKMGNDYPAAISTYPSWTAHETPYTAEWGNSVGFEFYLIEYELGESPRGSFNSVAERLNSFPDYAGFNYWAKGYYMYSISRIGPGTFSLYFNKAEHDKDNIFDLVGRQRITAPVSGWYHVSWNLLAEFGGGVYPILARLFVKISSGGYYGTAGRCLRTVEATGRQSFIVDITIYIEKDSYIYGTFQLGENTQVWTRGENDSSTIDITLLSTDPYDCK